LEQLDFGLSVENVFVCVCVTCIKCAGFAGPHRLLVPSDGGQSFPHLNVFDVGWELLDGTPRF